MSGAALRAIACCAAVLWCGSFARAAPTSNAAPPPFDEKLYPPWSHGGNDPATDRGLEFTVPDVDDMADFHGSIDNPKLVMFIGGNYFFVLGPLAEAFQKEYPEYRGHIFFITIPPGLLEKAMKMGDTFTSGNMTFTIHPDIYAAGRKKIDSLVTDGTLDGPAISYVKNDLTIMVPKGNPGHIKTLRDLGKSGVRLVMPNPAYEGVTKQIDSSLQRAGGERLVANVYGTKVRNGETILTHIHHRQTPLFLMQGRGVAGVTWRSEATFQEQQGHPISHVDIPAAFNSTAVYGAALVRNAPHALAGRRWLAFLQTDAAFDIFKRYGFKHV